uniref:Uncharacterized protein n=1 Tax=Arundo donax TaxID=35708 RepID=A0A0A9FE24_ARUDO
MLLIQDRTCHCLQLHKYHAICDHHN